jgi:hypothetical protein
MTLFGVSSFPEFYGLPDNTSDFDRLAAGGMSLVRYEPCWDLLEPTRGTFDESVFTRTNEIMRLADDRGISLIVCFNKTPAWARNGGTNDSPPTNPADYADALAHFAARYRARAQMRYEIWNEPNYAGFWGGTPNPAAYTAMLKLAYKAVKAVDPDAEVIAGSLSHYDPAFLAGMYAAGAHGYFDAFSLHPYTDGRAPDDDTSWPPSAFRPNIEGLHQALWAHGDEVPIWLTEFGYSVLSTDYKPVTEAQRAAYLTTAVHLVRSYGYVAGLAAYTLNTVNSAGKGLTVHGGAASASWAAYVAAVGAS